MLLNPNVNNFKKVKSLSLELKNKINNFQNMSSYYTLNNK